VLLYLVRHGETDWNLAHRIQGSTDIPLNERGREQARTTGNLLARREWDAIFTSPLARAAETARIIAGETGLGSAHLLDAVVERNYGSAEGLTDREIEARFPGDTPVPGRETRDEVVARVLPALMAIADGHPDQAVIVVTHGGVIRSVLNTIDAGSKHGMITNGSIHSVRHEDGSFELIAFDDPIELESLAYPAEDLDEQNAVERRETAEIS
jgi:probable phosphoglycerate mutase